MDGSRLDCCLLSTLHSFQGVNLASLFTKFALFRSKGKAPEVPTPQPHLPRENPYSNLPFILLSGDNARTAHTLHCDLADKGFRTQFAPSYSELPTLWQQRRHPMVLLEVSCAHGVEPAVNAALQLKRRNPLIFVGYLADPALHTSGLTGDAIFPRTSEQLAKALSNHFSN
jgi:hypothetical protein